MYSGLAVTTLKMSDFKLDLELNGGVLADWMDPVLSLLRVIFVELESVFSNTQMKDGEFLRCPELILSLVAGLIARLPDKVIVDIKNIHIINISIFNLNV